RRSERDWTWEDTRNTGLLPGRTDTANRFQDRRCWVQNQSRESCCSQGLRMRGLHGTVNCTGHWGRYRLTGQYSSRPAREPREDPRFPGWRHAVWLAEGGRFLNTEPLVNAEWLVSSGATAHEPGVTMNAAARMTVREPRWEWGRPCVVWPGLVPAIVGHSVHLDLWGRGEPLDPQHRPQSLMSAAAFRRL